ncbi:vitamin K epoxide reductase family protein [Chitinophagaceae bacterium LWZ2-11]
MFPFLKKLLEPKTNGPEIAYLLLKTLNIKVSQTTLKKEIEEHPDFTSLISISDVLRNYHVDNIAAKFDPDKLLTVPIPFITQIKGQNTNKLFFTLVNKIDENSVFFFDPEKHKWVVLSLEAFIKLYRGVVLLAEPDKDAGEKDYSQKIYLEKRNRLIQYLIALCIPFIVLAMGIVSLLQNGLNALLPFTFSLLTLSGCFIGTLLVWYEIDQYNPALQQICSAGKKVNCGAVLNSKKSKIWGISWSAIGFSYFMGELLLLLFLGINNDATLCQISWLNVLAVPYIFFSIYYQWKIAKQWCILCLSIQALLILQLTVALIGKWHALLSLSNITYALVWPTITAFAIPSIFLALLIPALQKTKENKRNKNELQRLKHDAQIFDALLTKQKNITKSTNGLGIFLGNPDAAYKIIKVCNPYCSPCAKAHEPMEELLDNNSNVQVQIIFTATNKEEDIRALPVKHLMAIAEKKDEVMTKKALDDWYRADEKNYDAFAAQYPMNGELENIGEKLDAMDQWCKDAEISFTPTFFINGHQLPNIYSVNDLKYFLTI